MSRSKLFIAIVRKKMQLAYSVWIIERKMLSLPLVCTSWRVAVNTKRISCHTYCDWIKHCRRPFGTTMASQRKRIASQPPNDSHSVWIRCFRILLWIVRKCVMKSFRIKWKRSTHSPTWSNRIAIVEHCHRSIYARQPYPFYLGWAVQWDATHTIHRHCCAEYFRPSKSQSSQSQWTLKRIQCI